MTFFKWSESWICCICSAWNHEVIIHVSIGNSTIAQIWIEEIFAGALEGKKLLIVEILILRLMLMRIKLIRLDLIKRCTLFVIFQNLKVITTLVKLINSLTISLKIIYIHRHVNWHLMSLLVMILNLLFTNDFFKLLI